MGVLVQVTATIFLCLSCINMGICLAWPSSVLLLFKSENTTLDRPMSDIDVTLFSSFPYIGALIAQPLMTMGILDKLGLKRTSMLASLLFVIAWSIIAVTNQVKIILLGVVIQGCGYGSFVLVLMYIGEIAQDSIRGTLTSCPNLFISFGLLMSYLLGGVLEYHMMVYTCLSLAVIGVVLIALMKESPVRLMLKGREEEAAEALAFYRQTNITSIEVLTELNNIRRSLNIELEDALPLTQVANQVNAKAEIPKKSCWQLFKTTSSIRRQFYLAMVLHTAFVYQGLPSMQVYAEPIFTATVGDDISPNLCSVVFGAILIVAGVIAAYLTDKIGRRPLQIHSSIVCGVCCLFLGTQVVTKWFPSWTMLVLIYVFATSHTLGSGTVPFVVTAEIFLPEVKGNIMILLLELEYFCSFSCMLLFSILIQSFGLSLIFYFFSLVCFITGIYFFYYLPETKGLPVYAIQALFTKEVNS